MDKKLVDLEKDIKTQVTPDTKETEKTNDITFLKALAERLRNYEADSDVAPQH